MNPEIEAKLERISTLMGERNRIDAELESLLGVPSVHKNGLIGKFEGFAVYRPGEKLITKKRTGGGNAKSRKVCTCSVCGTAGHNAKTCSKNKPANYGFGKKDAEPLFKVTSEVKEEIDGMLKEGKGSREIADFYGIEVKTANQAIAEAKGIKLPR